MIKKLMVLTACAFPLLAGAQTLFTFGKNSVSKEEFLRAFNKNNNPEQDRKTALREYLELYTHFKLKVQAARDLKMDTLPNQLADFRNFRRQIEPNYMNDEVTLNSLTREAFDRSQTELRIAQIFIPVKKDAPSADTLIAFNKITAAHNALQSGISFEQAVERYSEEEGKAVTRGDMGFITVFSLSYRLESLLYNTTPGNYTPVFRSNNGYHIFKVTEQRKARGKVKAAHIFLVFSPNSNDEQKKQVQHLADSVYQLLQKGAKWDDMVKEFSQDRNTVYMGGTLKEFGVGEYESSFENAAFALSKPDEISEPFATEYGYHILRLLDKLPVETDWQKANATGSLKQQINNDARSLIAKKRFQEQVKQKVAVKTYPYLPDELWAFVDSFLPTSTFMPVGKINEKTVIFSLPKQNVKAGDFAKYYRDLRASSLKEASKPYPELLEKYITDVSLEYYRNHLEEYNTDFKYQLQEFKDGNLLFEIMEKNVWNKAVGDSAGQQSYFQQHRNNYKWKSSVAAVIFTANDRATAVSIKDSLLAHQLNHWRATVEEYSGTVAADSGRFEVSQLPLGEKNLIKKGGITGIAINQQDGSASFGYITEVNPDNELRNYEDARGMVINDYQNELEKKWLQELKKKYPVTVNTKTWDEIVQP